MDLEAARPVTGELSVLHPLTQEEVALWASEHVGCPDGRCTDLGWNGLEAAYSCRHCMDRRRDLEQLLDPCEHRQAAFTGGES